LVGGGCPTNSNPFSISNIFLKTKFKFYFFIFLIDLYIFYYDRLVSPSY
jgi:hypothetical protein